MVCQSACACSENTVCGCSVEMSPCSGSMFAQTEPSPDIEWIWQILTCHKQVSRSLLTEVYHGSLPVQAAMKYLINGPLIDIVLAWQYFNVMHILNMGKPFLTQRSFFMSWHKLSYFTTLQHQELFLKTAKKQLT